MEDQSERILGHRQYELTNRNAETIARTQLHYAGAWSQSSWRGACNWEDREASVAHQPQVIEPQRRAITTARVREYGRARAVSRRAMNEMMKTVEIADGSADFRLLMVAAYGEGIMRSWAHARALFEDVTGLRLKKETEDDEDHGDRFSVDIPIGIDYVLKSRIGGFSGSHRIDVDSKQ